MPESSAVFRRYHSGTLNIKQNRDAWSAVGLRDSNISNLTKTVETNILEPLKRYGYIDSYKKLLNGKDIKYVIKRFQDAESQAKGRQGR
jgi:hypothetical protein